MAQKQERSSLLEHRSYKEKAMPKISLYVEIKKPK
jgi:hypothetical protein